MNHGVAEKLVATILCDEHGVVTSGFTRNEHGVNAVLNTSRIELPAVLRTVIQNELAKSCGVRWPRVTNLEMSYRWFHFSCRTLSSPGALATRWNDWFGSLSILPISSLALVTEASAFSSTRWLNEFY